MSQWGTSTSNESKPNWLTDEQKERTYATEAGWTIKQKGGVEEVLVAIRGLGTRLGTASITEVKFGTGTYTAGATRTVKVSFNEAVAVTGNPTLVVTGSVSGDVTATYASISANNTVLTFNFTVPAAGQTLSIGAQTVALAGGTINDPASAAADRVVSLSIAQGAGTKTTV